MRAGREFLPAGNAIWNQESRFWNRVFEVGVFDEISVGPSAALGPWAGVAVSERSRRADRAQAATILSETTCLSVAGGEPQLS